MPRIIICLLLFCINQKVFAESKKAILFGGACDYEALNPFDNAYSEFKHSATSLKERNWDVDLKYGPEASRQQIFKQLDEAILSAKNGGLKQLLIGTLTHGRPVSNDQAHSICVGGGEKKDWMNIDNVAFTSRLEELKTLGVEIGMIEASCFSGGSIAPLKKYGCIITAQSSNRPSWGAGPFEAINRTVKKANFSLSDIWRDNLLNDYTANQGHMEMPSNSEHDEIQNIEEDIMPLLLNRVQDYSIENMIISCQRNGEFLEKNLEDSFKSIHNIIGVLLDEEYSHFIGTKTEAPKSFKSLQDQIVNDLKEFKEKMKNFKIKQEQLENFDSESIIHIPSNEKYLSDLNEGDKKKLESFLKKYFRGYVKLKNGSTEINLLKMDTIANNLKSVEKNKFTITDEGLDAEVILSKVHTLLDSIPSNDIKAAKLKQSKRDMLAAELMNMQDEIEVTSINRTEKSPIKNRLARNTKLLIAFLSKMKETYSRKGNCSDFKI